MKKLNTLFIALVCIFICTSKTHGQTEPMLELSKENGTTFTIPENKKIKVIWVDNLRGVHTNKGKLEILDNSTIKIEDQIIPIEQITKIKMHTVGSRTLSAKLGAAAIVGVGLGIGMNSSDQRTMNSNGVLVATLGVGCALVAFPTFIIPKTFNLEKKYSLQVLGTSNDSLIVASH